jgi:transcriptional regulator with XRE-family HTH domain
VRAVWEAGEARRPLTRRQPFAPQTAAGSGIQTGSLATHDSGGVGGRLRVARRSVGLTQKQLAEELGVESITVSRWERGVTTPSLPRLRRIAELTETTVSDLVRAPDASSAHAVELSALREELAETRAIVDRVARTLDQLARSRSARDSASVSRHS